MKKHTRHESLAILRIRGRVGDLVFKRYRTGMVITKYPDMSKAGCSTDQRQQRNHFQLAVERAKVILANPEQKRYYNKLPGKGSAWNKALSACMKENKPISMSV